MNPAAVEKAARRSGCPRVADLIGGKYLVGTRTCAPAELLLRGVRTQIDYVVSEPAERVNTDAKQRGYKPGWAAYKFRDKFGFMPPFVLPKPIEPSREVLSWIRSRNIASAKSKQKAVGA
jgi:hypothetical protein